MTHAASKSNANHHASFVDAHDLDRPGWQARAKKMTPAADEARCHRLPYASIRDLHHDKQHGAISDADFDDILGTVAHDDPAAAKKRKAFLDDPRDTKRVKSSVAAHNSTPANLRLGDSRINSGIGDRYDPGIVDSSIDPQRRSPSPISKGQLVNQIGHGQDPTFYAPVGGTAGTPIIRSSTDRSSLGEGIPAAELVSSLERASGLKLATQRDGNQITISRK